MSCCDRNATISYLLSQNTIVIDNSVSMYWESAGEDETSVKSILNYKHAQSPVVGCERLLSQARKHYENLCAIKSHNICTNKFMRKGWCQVIQHHGELHYKILRNTGWGSTTDSSAAVAKNRKGLNIQGLSDTTFGTSKLCVFLRVMLATVETWQSNKIVMWHMDWCYSPAYQQSVNSQPGTYSNRASSTGKQGGMFCGVTNTECKKMVSIKVNQKVQQTH